MSGTEETSSKTSFKSNLRGTWRVILVSEADMLLSESLRIFAERCSCTKYRIIRNGSAGFGNPSGFLFAYFYLFIFRVVIYSVSELCKNDKIDKKI